VLSGGGAKTAAHVGALRALADQDLSPAHFVGTSMGAVIAACFASGLPYEEVVQRVSTVSRKDVAALSPKVVLGPFADSLLRETPLRETIATLVPARTFDELEIPLTVTAVDLDTGELVLFGAGGEQVSLVDALYASSALPVYYRPAVIGERRLGDGGLRAVLPLDVAGTFQPDTIFAVSVGPSFSEREAAARSAPGLLGVHNNAMRILMAAQEEAAISKWQQDGAVRLVVVRPQVDSRATFAVENVVRYIEEGYRAAYRALSERQPSP
jgi:NTE family protein